MLHRAPKTHSIYTTEGYAEGYLMKQGRRFKRWKKRFYIFREGCLYYRRRDQESAKIIRRGFVVDVHYSNDVTNGIRLELRSGRIMLLSAQTEALAESWFDVFNTYVADRQKKKEMRNLYRKQNERLDPIAEDEAFDFEFEDSTSISETESDSDEDYV